MATSAKDLVAKFDRLSRTMPDAHLEALGQSSMVAKETLLRAAVGGGLKQGGNLPSSSKRKWGVRYKMSKVGEFAGSTLIAYFGPVHWQEGGTKDHWVASKKVARAHKAARRKAQGPVLGGVETGSLGVKGAIRTPQGLRSRARVKGARARHFWRPARAKVIEETPKIQHAATTRALINAGFGK